MGNANQGLLEKVEGSDSLPKRGLKEGVWSTWSRDKGYSPIGSAQLASMEPSFLPRSHISWVWCTPIALVLLDGSRETGSSRPGNIRPFVKRM